VTPTRLRQICHYAAVPSLLTAACAGLLIATSAAGRLPLTIALAVVQVALVAGWFWHAQLTTRWLAAGGAIAGVGAVVADLTLLRAHDQADVRGLAGVLAAVVGVAFVVQLARRDGRARLTDALAATVATGALAIAGASLLGVRGGRGGVDVVAVALVAAGVAVLPVQRRLPLWVSLPVGAAAGIGFGVLAGQQSTVVGAGAAAAVAAVAVAVALAARAAALVAAGGRSTWPVASTLPLLVVAPGVLVVARIMVG
jgi:hypothetical protein